MFDEIDMKRAMEKAVKEGVAKEFKVNLAKEILKLYSRPDFRDKLLTVLHGGTVKETDPVHPLTIKNRGNAHDRSRDDAG